MWLDVLLSSWFEFVVVNMMDADVTKWSAICEDLEDKTVMSYLSC